MATYTAAADGGNWADDATWGGGGHPVAGDTAILNATSGNVTLSAAAACAVLDCTGYTGTLAFATYSLTATGNVTLPSGMSATVGNIFAGIICSTANTITGGISTFDPLLTLTGTGTYTLNSAGTTWTRLGFSGGAKTVSLGATLTVTNLFCSAYSVVTMGGTYDIAATNAYFGSGTSSGIVLVSGRTLTISTVWKCYGAAAAAAASVSTFTLSAVTPSTSANVVFNGAAADVTVTGCIFTDIAYSGTNVANLDNWYGGTLTRCGDTFFTISSGSATAGATYTNNGATFTVTSTVASGTKLICTRSGLPAESGTLTKASGTGDATLTFSAYTTGGITNRTSADIGGGTGGVTGRCLQLGVGVC
jgi:hypothetical protein